VTSTGEHWDAVFATREPGDVSWFQREPWVSLRLIASVSTPESAVADVGAGASFLADRLVGLGYRDITLVDVSRRALEAVERRLGPGRGVTLACADVRSWEPTRCVDVWHDRAALHFLVEDADLGRYAALAARTVSPGGALVLGVFAADGPTTCSGLPVRRHGPDDLAAWFAPAFGLEHHEREEHVTPSGATQRFTWVLLRRGS
jgi:SAM-dependent methyltransferase